MIEGLKPYAEYKESGQKWLGQVPRQWASFPLCRVATPKSECGRTDLELLSVYLHRGVIRYADSGGQVHKPSLDLSKYQVVAPGDFVLNNQQAWRGSIGVSKFQGIISPAYVVLKLSPKLNPGYANYLFRSPAMVAQYVAASRGVGDIQRNLFYPDLRNSIAIVPPADEQAAIVRFLDHANRKIDGFIRAKRKLIGLLNEQKQAIIHRAVTRGLHPDVSLKPSGIPWIGDVPQHWEISSLNRLMIERIQKNDPIKTTNILSLSMHDGVVPYAEKTRPGGNKAKSDLTAYKLAHPGDIVVNSMNVVVGSVGLSKYFGAVSPVYYMLRPRSSSDLVEFFDLIFKDKVFQSSLFGLGNGIMVIQSRATGKLNTIRMRIPMTKLGRVCLPHPEPKEQAAIIAVVASEIERLSPAIARTEREIALMQEYRTRLTADIVTGKLDVREAAAKLPDLSADATAEPVAEDSVEEIETEEIP